MINIRESNIIELKEKADKIIKRGWIECSNNANGSAGLLLERLLGLSNHNFAIPDYDGIELKTKFINSKFDLTLFNATPDGYLFSIKRLFETYGYQDHNNKDFKAFHMTFCSEQRKYVKKNIYAKVHVDRDKRIVALNFYMYNCMLIDNEVSWSFDMLKEKLETKLKYLFIMYVKRTNFRGKSFCKYLSYEFFQYKGFDNFLKSLECGHIKITFSIDMFKSNYRFGNIHDHGTSFNIDMNHIEDVFTRQDLSTLFHS